MAEYKPRRDYECKEIEDTTHDMNRKRTNLLVSLSDCCREIILGSLLGDGSLKIHTGYKNARFSFRHSQVQEEYFRWKARALAEIAGEVSIFVQSPDGYSTKPMLRFQSRALEQLTELYRLTHRGKLFSIRRKWLNQLSPLSLAIWWCDDGSIVGNGRKGVFCTDGFSQEDVKRIARYLQVVWNVQTHVGALGRKRGGTKLAYYRLWLSTEELKKFLRIILPYVPVPSMLRKAILLYKDPQIQQRWISEVIQLSVFSRSQVQQALADKRDRWRVYRE